MSGIPERNDKTIATVKDKKKGIMDFNSTVKGSALEGFYPAGWDLEKIDACIDTPENITKRQDFWNPEFTPVMCDSLGDFFIEAGSMYHGRSAVACDIFAKYLSEE